MIPCRYYIFLLIGFRLILARYEEPHRPCFFNSLCTCSNAGPDLGSVSCLHVPFTTIPTQLRFSAIYIMSLKFNQLQMLEELSLNGTGLWKLQINENLLRFLPPKAFVGLEKTLSVLDLNGNQIARFPKEAVTKLEKLQTLNLARNHIGTVHPDDLFHLGKTLKELDLSANSMSYIHNDAFKNMEALETLNLSENVLISINDVMLHSGFIRLKSLNLMDNQLDHMPLTILAKLRSIKTINLSKNFISSLNDDSGITRKIQLEELNLEYNYVQELSHNSFKAFLRIDKIYLGSNPLTAINDSTFLDISAIEIDLSDCLLSDISDNAFIGLENSLEVLDLSFNRLKVFPFMPLKKITNLNLKGNDIDSVDGELLEQVGVSLKVLDMSGENMGIFPTSIFGHIPNIRYLNIKKDQSEKITSEDFIGIGPTFEELHLARNSITAVGNDAFSHISGLKLIDLSFNKIKVIDEDAFAGISHSLTKLILHKSLAMTEFPASAFKHLSKLQYLDISSNRLAVLPPGSFHCLEHLKHLNLNHNNLSELKASLPDEKYNPELQSIKLAFNKLHVIETNAFNDLKKITQIHLNDNTIKSIQKKAFADLDSLIVINLEGNCIQNLENDAFQNLPTIQVINFSRNKLIGFNLDAFDQVGRLSTLMINVERNQIQGLYRNHTSRHKSSNIKILNFSHNNISHLDSEYFQPVRHSLTVLDLSNNFIENLTNGALREMEHLQVLLISQNKIVSLYEDFFKDLVRLQILNISQNHLCNLTENVFGNQNNLRILDASDNNLTVLEENIFRSTKLEQLDLSTNNMEFFPEESLCQVSDTLQYLDLSKNNINFLNFSNVKCLEKLRHFIISQNELYSIEDDVVNHLNKIIVLDLSHNPLNDSVSLLFENEYPNLEYLSLANTSISAIPNMLAPSLVSLNISQNFIKSIEPETIHQLENLQELDISSNYLKSTYSHILSNMNQLRSLHFNNNPIQSLNNESFLHLMKLQELFIQNLNLQKIDPGTFLPLRSLRKLEMDTYSDWNEHNLTQMLKGNRALREIRFYVKEEKFTSMFTIALPKSLNKLTLEGNQLLELADNTLQNLEGKTLILNIHDTRVTKLKSELFRNMENVRNFTALLKYNALEAIGRIPFSPANEVSNKRLVKIDLSDNELICDCSFSWVWEWVTDYEYQLNCNENRCDDEILNDLRGTSCLNKKNNSIVDVFKTDLQCFSRANSISTNIFALYTFIGSVVLLYLTYVI